MQYAGFWLRLVAYVIDNIILLIIGSLSGFVFGAIFGSLYSLSMGTAEGAEEAVLFPSLLLGLVINWLYYAFQESSPKQATLGKQAVGIVVVDLDGKRISFGKASGRLFGKLLSGFILLIGFVMAGFTEKKQALHDIISGCLVIKK
jgi:uncharacterized RDD family membrane protein YckC